MAKISLTNIADFTPSAITAINSNSAAIIAAMDLTLFRDGTTPNQMTADLDMNSRYILNINDLDMNNHRILNLPAPMLNEEPVRLIDMINYVPAGGGGGGGGGGTIATQAEAEAGVSNVVYMSPLRTNQAIGALGVKGPVSATDGHYAVFDGATGRLIKDGGAPASTTIPFFNVKVYGAIGNGVTNDSPAFQLAFNAAIAAGGGMVYIPSGTYRINTGMTSITANNIGVFAEPGTIIDYRGAAAGAFLEWTGSEGTPTNVNANITSGDTTVTVVSTAGFAVGDYVRVFGQDSIRTYSWISRVINVSSPILTLSHAAPISMATATYTTAFNVRKLNPVTGGGIIGNGMVIDGVNSVGGSLDGAIHIYYTADFGIENVVFKNFFANLATGTIWVFSGVRPRISNLSFYKCGNGANSTSFLGTYLTNFSINNINASEGTGFGPQLRGCSFGSATNWNSTGTVNGRGTKFNSCLCSNFSNILINDTDLNGIAVTNGTSKCTFSNLNATAALGATGGIGLWLSDQSCVENTFSSVTTRDNFNYSLNVGPTDLRNQFIGINAPGIANVDPLSLTAYVGRVGYPSATNAYRIGLPGLTSGSVNLGVPSVITTYNFTLPPDPGTSGYVLSTDGAGTTSWIVPGGGGGGTPGGSTTQVQFNNAGAFGASANLTWVSPALTIGTSGSVTGQLKLTGSTAGTITLQGQASSGTYNYNLPTTAGASGDFAISGGGTTNPMTWLTPASGIATFLSSPTSANLAAAVTNETGTGVLVFATSPTLVTPILGTPTSGNLANCTGYPISALATLGTGVATALAINVGSAGAFVTFNGALGTPSSGTLTNATGLPIAGITGLAAGIATWLATPSSANLSSALTDKTGTGVNVFATSPTLVTPLLGTPTSGNLANCTGYPVASLSGLGTGVATALAVNVSTAGSFVVNGGALGTPTSGVVTNLTGTASININGTVGATTPATGAFTTLTVNTFPMAFADAGFDVIMAWDDSANTYKNMSLTDITTKASPVAGDYVLIYDSTGDLRKANWSSLPAGSGSPGGSNTQMQYNNSGTFGGASNMVYVSSNLGIGTDTNPQTLLTLSKNTATGISPFEPDVALLVVGQDASAAEIDLVSFSNTTFGSVLVFRQARGTGATPARVQTGDTLGAFGARGYYDNLAGSAGWPTSSKINTVFSASENWTNTAQGGYYSIFTTNTGTTTRSAMARFQPSGGFSVGISQIATDHGDGVISAGTYLQSVGGWKRVTADQSLNTSSTLTTITDLSVNVAAGLSYKFRAVLYVTAPVGGGIKAAIAGSCTATSIVYESVNYQGNAITAHTRASALATTVAAATNDTAPLVIIEGTITVNAAGTLLVQFAQNSPNGTNTTILRGSTFSVEKVI